MKDQQAREILQSLVSGADPFTGEELAMGTVLQHAGVLRALLAGCSALDDRVARAYRRAHQPKNVGQAWTPEEQERLVQAFKGKEGLTEIAVRHGRTVRAIESRLEMLGLITEEQRTTKERHGSSPRVDANDRAGARGKRFSSKKRTGA
jgi:hypothetical protein